MVLRSSIPATSPATSLAIGRGYYPLIAFRAAWTIACILFFNAIVPLGTAPWIVSVAGILGVLAGSRLAHSKLTSLGFSLGLGSAWVAVAIFFAAMMAIFPRPGEFFFSYDVLQLHTGTCLLAFSVAAASTWFFWRSRSAITFEALLLGAICIVIFSGHRNLHLDRPKILNSLAWRLGVDHLTMLMLVGSGLLAASISYLYIASQADRPATREAPPFRFSSGRNIALSLGLLGLLATFIYWIQALLYAHFNAAILAQVANGVGMGSEGGVSPLTFQSALGSTNQPAALVRLEGDYTGNPFTPMMYMRESALSSFNGREMVFAGRAYDTDLTATRPTESFTGKEDADLIQRTPLVQSVYLLADHENVFAVDYPVSIVQLKNPKPNRFKAAYRAYSIAPAFAIADLSDLEVGDPRWTPEVREHYLTPHTDPRYKELALKITAKSDKPVEKMLAITNYLSRTAIYTLTPNHEVAPGEDPVAPFLFGDHRGYCVHFAHAIVFMARSLGIPARVATGYLTDLSQARDGHILLRMSDRHAWAEVFIAGRGWIPFDIQPDQVESHADTQVDPKMLEELMGMLEPGEEILPPDQTKDEPGMRDPDQLWLPDRAVAMRVLKIALSIITAIFIGLHLFIFFGWRFVRSPRAKLRLGYVACSAALHNIGVRREFGETRTTFANRVPLGALDSLTPLILSAAYDKTSAAPSLDAVNSAMAKAREALRGLPKWKQFFSFVNPAAVLRLIGGGRW